MTDNDLNNISAPQEEENVANDNNTGNLKPNCPPRGKLNCYNWLSDIPGGYAEFDMVEVQFKNTRKGFYNKASHYHLPVHTTHKQIPENQNSLIHIRDVVSHRHLLQTV